MPFANQKKRLIMVKLEYFVTNKWVSCGHFHDEHTAWVALGGCDFNYRTVDAETGRVLTDKSNNGKD
jgi:expansin (peptidoglycan-binding protein)